MLSKEEQEKIQQLCEESPQAAQVRELLHKEKQLQLSMISHEIRNPVTLINSLTQLMGTTYPEITGSQHWSNLIENIQFLRVLLGQISDYNNSQKLKRTEFNLYRMLESYLNSIRYTLEEQNISLTFTKRGAVPAFLMDREKITQVFMNLIRNAAEALEEMGENHQGEIQVVMTADFDFVTVAIKDNGPGIPEEYLPTLFDFFVTHKKDGTGLGLAICKNIIEAHQGTMKVESKPGSGATFIIKLPILYR